MARNNPIARRVARLSDQWLEFVEQPAARLWRLLVQPDEQPAVDGFIAMECDERAGRLPDLFILLSAPFEPGADYGARLVAELAGRFEDGSGEQGAGDGSAVGGAGNKNPDAAADQVSAPPFQWTPSPRSHKETDVAFTARIMDDFANTAVPNALLCMVLRPVEPLNQPAFQLWMQALLPLLSERVRVLVVEDASRPLLAPWPEAQARLVVVRPANLDMGAAFAEVSAQVGDEALPAGQFRTAYLELSQLAAGKDLELTRAKAEALSQFAELQGWLHMVVPVKFLLAAALLEAQDLAGCLRAFEEAEAVATRGAMRGNVQGSADVETGLDVGSRKADGMPSAAGPFAPGQGSSPHAAPLGASTDADAHGANANGAADSGAATKAFDQEAAMADACQKLRLPARMAQGSVMIAAGDYIRAARFYEDTAPFASEMQEPLVTLDCQRLASFCYLQANEAKQAFRIGLLGLETARALPDDRIAASTLPFLGDHMLRMSEQLVAYREHARPIMAELTARLGPDWRAALAPQT